MKVKICGITRAEDARLAASLGAWAVGFIFWPKSPRHIGAAQARSIADALPPHVERVGVFVDERPDRVREVAAAAGLTILQLHGHESRKDWNLALPVMKAVGLDNGDHESVLDEWSDVRALLDAHDPERRGGTGRTTDWAAALRIAHSREIVLAGGLRPENVADAIARVRPWGIDVSSGVEDAPGVKNHDRMRALFAAVARQANVDRGLAGASCPGRQATAIVLGGLKPGRACRKADVGPGLYAPADKRLAIVLGASPGATWNASVRTPREAPMTWRRRTH